jgi:hypothetical protein
LLGNGTVPFPSYFSDTDLHGFDFDQILSITNLMESYDIDHNNLKSVLIRVYAIVDLNNPLLK